MNMAWLKKYSLNWPAPFYVLLLAAFPVLYLYAYNISEMNFGQALLPLAICVAGAFLLWALLTLLLRDGRKAGISVALFLLFFFSYGRIYELLNTWDVFVPKHAYLLSIMLFLWGYCVYFISRAKRDFRTTTSLLNAIAVVLIFINIANISIYQITKPKLTASEPVKAASAADNVTGAAQTRPDIYFIILDEYSHPDTMKEYYNYDNSQFMKSLEDAGFFIAYKSRTRSLWTPQAISQVLNMEYLTPGWIWDGKNKDKDYGYVELPFTKGDYPGDPPWSEPNYRRYAYNKVAELLKAKGYKYVYFGNQVDEGRWESYMKDAADLYYNYYQSTSTPWISEFQRILWKTTMLNPFYYRLVGSQYETSYSRCVLNTLAHLKAMPSLDSPKFVFAHIYCPHAPLVFGPNGEYIDPINWENLKDKEFQLGQYIFISREIKKVVDEILEKSKTPPIIVLQSDHSYRSHLTRGIGSEEWRKILNAQYLPDGGKERLYDSVSPVNTFRLIFNYYFGTSYPLLEDD